MSTDPLARALVAALSADPEAVEALRRVLLADTDAAADPDEWLTLDQVAELTKAHVVTVRRWAASGELQSVTEGPGCRRYVKRRDAVAFRDGPGRSAAA